MRRSMYLHARMLVYWWVESGPIPLQAAQLAKVTVMATDHRPHAHTISPSDACAALGVPGRSSSCKEWL